MSDEREALWADAITIAKEECRPYPDPEQYDGEVCPRYACKYHLLCAMVRAVVYPVHRAK